MRRAVIASTFRRCDGLVVHRRDDPSGFGGVYKQRVERRVFERKAQQSLDFSACDPSAKRRRNNIDLACAQRSINRWSAASQNRSCLRD